MDDQVGEHGLLQRRLERLDELVRELADEADRVGDQVSAAAVAVGARGRVEGVEEPLPHPSPGSRERVQQGRLARVGVAGEGHDREAPSRRGGPASPRGFAPGARAGGAGSRSGRGPGGGRSRSGSPRARGSRSRRPAARDGSTGRACARGCTRAAPAPPGAFPRRCGRGRRRCRGSPRCGRSRARRAPPPGSAPGAGTSSSSQATRLASQRAISRLELGQLAPPEVAVGIGPRADLDQLAGGRHAGGAQELLQLGEGVVVAGRAGSAAIASARWRARRFSTPAPPAPVVGLGLCGLGGFAALTQV